MIKPHADSGMVVPQSCVSFPARLLYAGYLITENLACICASQKAHADKLPRLVGETELGVGYADRHPRLVEENEFGVGCCFDVKGQPQFLAFS